jgi:hypothetical protein
MFLHASHNLFIQGLPALTTDKGITAYLIDEFGAVSAIVAIIVAFIFWKKRGQNDAESGIPEVVKRPAHCPG